VGFFVGCCLADLPTAQAGYVDKGSNFAYNANMEYKVTITKRAKKTAAKMPQAEQKRLIRLLANLRALGPVRSDWPNYSSLGGDEYHCHLSYHWVACWRHEKGIIKIEVYYAGSRENAPY